MACVCLAVWDGWQRRAEDGTDGCACEMHGAVAAAWNACEMSGRGNWWVRSMKTPSLGNSACAKIGCRAPGGQLSVQLKRLYGRRNKYGNRSVRACAVRERDDSYAHFC